MKYLHFNIGSPERRRIRDNNHLEVALTLGIKRSFRFGDNTERLFATNKESVIIPFSVKGLSVDIFIYYKKMILDGMGFATGIFDLYKLMFDNGYNDNQALHYPLYFYSEDSQREIEYALEKNKNLSLNSNNEDGIPNFFTIFTLFDEKPVSFIRFLSTKGINMRLRNKSENTALGELCNTSFLKDREKFLQIFDIFVETAIKQDNVSVLNETYNGRAITMTPLLFTFEKGVFKYAKLVNRIYVPLDYGITAFEEAVKAGEYEIADRLVEGGILTSEKVKYTCFYYTLTDLKNPEAIEYIIDKGFPVRDAYLKYAIGHNASEEIIKLLKDELSQMEEKNKSLTKEDLERMTKEQLLSKAREIGLKGYSSKRKAELIDMIFEKLPR